MCHHATFHYATYHAMQHATPCLVVHATMQVEAQPAPVHLRPQSQESQIVTEGCCCQADLVTNLLELVPQLQHVQWHGLLQANHVEPANFLTEATVQKSHGSDYQSMTAQVRTCHVTWCFLALGVAWANGNSWGSDRS